jgi:hypothetical protein
LREAKPDHTRSLLYPKLRKHRSTLSSAEHTSGPSADGRDAMLAQVNLPGQELAQLVLGADPPQLDIIEAPVEV